MKRKVDVDRFEVKEKLVSDMLAGTKTMGEVGRALRVDALQMSQTNVCKLTGLSRQVVSDIENDMGNPRLDSMQAYFKLMGLELAVLPRERSEIVAVESTLSKLTNVADKVK
ncbi:helix-turn-helix domain-containing protein [Rheinheimera salexigens]|uniref:Transcriptional regulator n=1 Tax=Rheinheimera salexigens TaxID=1628148 RepID=A0A1E7Q9N6_9GAMM|nr:helix-turn-helix transcriptional regulator [Rheinheimera salexigens]OEY70850.1 transcriptional regulator [Rheinheimera salexigens]